MKTILLASLLSISTSHAATLFSLDDFQDGTPQNWQGNSGILVVPDGGPTGPGDAYLSMGNPGQARLATFNKKDHSGDYLTAGIVAVTVDMMAPASNPTAPEMRIVLFTAGASFSNDRWTSTTAKTVPNDGVWRPYSFSFEEADLTQAQGSTNYANLIQNVDRLMFRYDPGAPDADGVFYGGLVNLDNVQLIPEPSPTLFLALTTAALMSRRRRS